MIYVPTPKVCFVCHKSLELDLSKLGCAVQDSERYSLRTIVVLNAERTDYIEEEVLVCFNCEEAGLA